MKNNNMDISENEIKRIVDKPYYSISELATMFGISTQALRFYHRVGLLIPGMIKDNGYRYYDYNQIYRLATIVYLRKCGFSIDNIQDYLDENDYRNNLLSLRKTVSAMESEIQNLKYLIQVLSQRADFVEGWEPEIKADVEEICLLPSQKYIILGRGEPDYMRRGIFSIPTFVIYQEHGNNSYRQAFGGLINTDSDTASYEQEEIHLTPPGHYLKAFYHGPYSGCYQRICDLRNKYSQYTFAETTYCVNIIEPFILSDSTQYVTLIEMPVLENDSIEPQSI